MQTNERGFAHLILIIGIAVLALGATGYAVKVHYDHTKLTATQAPSQPTLSPKPSVYSQPVAITLPQISGEQSGTLEIPELNIELTLPSGLSRVTYYPMYDYYNRLDGYGITSAVALGIDPACTSADAAVGSLFINPSGTNQGNGASVDEKVLGGGKSLYLTEPNGVCASMPANETDAQFNAVFAKLNGQTVLLRQALASAKYIN